MSWALKVPSMVFLVNGKITRYADYFAKVHFSSYDTDRIADYQYFGYLKFYLDYNREAGVEKKIGKNMIVIL